MKIDFQYITSMSKKAPTHTRGAGLGVLRRSKRQADYLREYHMEHGKMFDES